MSRQMTAVSMVCLASMILVSTANAQPRFAQGQGGAMMQNPLMLLANEQIREELEIVDEQWEQLRALQGEMFRGLGDFRDLRDRSPEEIREQMQQRMQEMEGRVNDILLPHQQQRLGQLMVQFQARSNVGRALTSDQVAQQLGLNDQQRRELREAAERAQQQFEERVAQARRQMEDQILGALTPEQREKYRELVGESFDFGNFRGGFGQGAEGLRGDRQRGERFQQRGGDRRPQRGGADF